MKAEGSGLFCPYKSLGLVTDSLPCVIRRMPKQRLTTVLTAVQSVVHQYNGQSLRLISVSDPLPSKILALAADNQFVYAAHSNKISALHLSRQVHFVYEGSHEADIKLLLPFGQHLISIDHDNRMVIWDIHSQEVYGEHVPDVNFSISAISHPPTYMNKILIGSSQGTLRLVNIKTSKMIHQFKGWDSRVTVLEPSPAQDIMCIGLEDGRIMLHNLKLDETLLSFRQDWGPVLAIGFRMDGIGVMMSSGGNGNIAFWDLEKRKLLGQMSDIHGSKPITAIRSIIGEPLMITNGYDNSLRTWIFDLPDGLGRELACRQGHSLPPNTCRFYGHSGEMVLSGGEDSTVKAFSTWKDTKQYNLGTAGKISRQEAKKRKIEPESIKLPPIVEIVSETSREAGWDNVVCRHSQSPVTSSWTSRRLRLGSHQFLAPRFSSMSEWKKAVTSSVCLSSCGNFVYIGYTSGHLDAWNIQSGLFRGSFKEKGEKNVIKQRGHFAPINGIVTDLVNVNLVSGCANGRINFWRIKSQKLLARLELGGKADTVRMTLNRENNLLAVGTGSGLLVVIDVECRRVVRQLSAASGLSTTPIRDLTFSPSGQWLMSVDGMGHLRVWDLPTSNLIEYIKFENKCRGVSWSPNAEFIATVHDDSRGVYLWTNKSVYSPVYAMKPLPLDYNPTNYSLPLSAPITIDQEDDEEVIDLMEDEDQGYHEPTQIQPDLISLSGLPTPKWAHLLELDIISERNRPIEPPKKPKSAPFFLPTTMGLEGFTFNMEADEAGSKILSKKLADLRPKSDFAKALLDAYRSQNGWKVPFDMLKKLSPAGIDTEIRKLGIDSGGSNELMTGFLWMSRHMLASNTEFELAHSYLSLYIKVHQEDLWKQNDDNDDIRSLLCPLLDEVNRGWSDINQSFDSANSVIQWLKMPSTAFL